MKKLIPSSFIFGFLVLIGYSLLLNNDSFLYFNSKEKIGQKIDSLNGVYVFHNGFVTNVSGRNLTPEGYNLGLKYQCVEFVKRYYYKYLDHKMPNSYGHAKDFFNSSLEDGDINVERNLMQFKNYGKEKPQINDILVFNGTSFNPYGHIAIVYAIHQNELEIIQQNAGLLSSPRESIKIKKKSGKWILNNKNILGWLRKK